MLVSSGTQPLDESVQSELQSFSGTAGIALRDLGKARSLNLGSMEPFPSASVIKVGILLELAARVDAGEVAMQQRIALTGPAKVEGSGVLSMLRPGLELALDDLAHLMINVSDNTASNMLIDFLGCERITGRLESLGLRRTRLQRKFYDFEARDRGLDNWAAADDLAELFAGIERREVVSAWVCDWMLSVLRQQQFSSRIPALLPPETTVAHKTGSISTACHDAGIIYAPAGPLVVVVLTRGEPGKGWTAVHSETLIRRVARLTYDHWGAAAG
jgi:beta-lactamase class A